MPEQSPPNRDEERETVSYTLPRRIIKAVAIHSVEADLKNKSRAAEDLIERGLDTLTESASEKVPA